MPNDDEGPTIMVWFAVLAVVVFFIGLWQSVIWMWFNHWPLLVIFVGLLLAMIVGRSMFRFFDS